MSPERQKNNTPVSFEIKVFEDIENNLTGIDFIAEPERESEVFFSTASSRFNELTINTPSLGEPLEIEILDSDDNLLAKCNITNEQSELIDNILYGSKDKHININFTPRYLTPSFRLQREIS